MPGNMEAFIEGEALAKEKEKEGKIIPSIIEVSRTFNTGNYTSERISLTVEVPYDMSIDEAYKQTYGEIGRLFKKEGWR
jgi:hypothetical protein